MWKYFIDNGNQDFLQRGKVVPKILTFLLKKFHQEAVFLISSLKHQKWVIFCFKGQF